MSREQKSDLFRQALDELGEGSARIDQDALDAACRMLSQGGKIVVYGCGR